MRKKETFTLTPALVRRYVLHLKKQERAAAIIQKYVHDPNALMAHLDGEPLTKAALIQ